jgi:predicted xylan-binding protein with Ca-dependent carbohydrate-binding module
VTVTFANNFIYPGQSGDRNLYVDGVSYNGNTVSNSTTPIYESPLFPPNSTVGNIAGNAVFSVNDTTPVPSGAGSNDTTSPGAVSVGDGPDTLKLGMAEDAYQGDAQFTVSVDGKQIGGTQTTTARIAEGQSQEFDVHGNFGSGSHTVSVKFLNDQIGDFYPSGTPGLPAQGQWAVDTTDRNLYVTGMTLNGGAPAGGTPWELSSEGSKDFSVTAGSGSGSGTSDNATVSSASLSVGSTDNMNFVAPSTTSDNSSSSSSGGSSNDSISSLASGSGSGSGSGTDTSQMTTSPQDFSVPSSSGASVDSSNSGANAGGHTWNWQDAHAAWVAAHSG